MSEMGVKNILKILEDGPGTCTEIALAITENPSQEFRCNLSSRLRYMRQMGYLRIMGEVPADNGSTAKLYGLRTYTPLGATA